MPRDEWTPPLRRALEEFADRLSGALERAVLVGHTVALAAVSRLSEELLPPAEAAVRAGAAVAAAAHLEAFSLLRISQDRTQTLAGWSRTQPPLTHLIEELSRLPQVQASVYSRATGATGLALTTLALPDALGTGAAAWVVLPGGTTSVDPVPAGEEAQRNPDGQLVVMALRWQTEAQPETDTGAFLAPGNEWSADDRVLLEAAARAVAVAAEREQMLGALTVQTAHTRLLLELSQRAFAARGVLEAVEAVMTPLLSALRASYVIFAQREGHEFTVRTGVGTPPPPLTQQDFIFRVRDDKGSVGQAVLTCGVMTASTLSDVPEGSVFSHPEKVAAASVVVRGPRSLDGLLIVLSEGPRHWTPEDVRLLEAVGDTLSGVLERLHREEQAHLTAREYEIQAVLAARLQQVEQPLDLARVGLDACVELIGCHHASYLDLQTGPQVWSGNAPPAFVDAMTLGIGRPLSDARRLAAAPPQVTWHLDYAATPDAQPTFVKAGLRSTAFIPVQVDDLPIGVLLLAWFDFLKAPPPGVEAALRTLAERLSRSFERSAHIRQIEATREGALQALGGALEAREFETQGHTERVVSGSVRLGARLGLSREDLDALRQGAYLHDIGKLMVPDAVLLKPGPLSPHEREQMLCHTHLGANLAASIPTLPPLARQVVRWHHERWDGSGYPDGLTAQAIPLAARIFSVVDVYDTLTTVQPYKTAWTPQEARAELVRQSGRQFDPVVVSAFLTQLDEGEPASAAPQTPSGPMLAPTTGDALGPGARPAAGPPNRKSLDRLLERGLEIASLSDPSQVISRALDLALDLLSVQRAVVWLGPDAGGELELAYALGAPGAASRQGTRIPLSSGVVGAAAVQGVPLRVRDSSGGLSRTDRDELYGSVLAVPIMRAQTVLGVLVASRNPGQEISSEDQAILERLAQVIGIALENVQRVRELEDLRTQAESVARIDHLTGVGNRLGLEQAYADARRSALPGTPLSLAVLDLVGFKTINDRYGHPQGDEVLRRVAAELKRSHPGTFRLGGDEFALLLTLDEQQATAEVKRAIQRIEYLDTGTAGKVRANAGVAQWKPGMSSLEVLLDRADQRMYRAKRAGLPTTPEDESSEH
ncbi:diguanylate cyclase (plasmid) [Deinococcus sp. KNUC1210]|uniref:HD domain-containing phosphohydrolase n=1 Tax=Deinococcus sp. KNUC1210 TaxID=2917691 RepID=UPI001EF11371|nr:HD domain-containing phosphohydrolase [Deinococcus sp. KNUC1210]ULH14201.1 diguanylate cyclase [Deinococcus sp. KNUC1210]